MIDASDARYVWLYPASDHEHYRQNIDDIDILLATTAIAIERSHVHSNGLLVPLGEGALRHVSATVKHSPRTLVLERDAFAGSKVSSSR
jgi:hypothetical protein